MDAVPIVLGAGAAVGGGYLAYKALAPSRERDADGNVADTTFCANVDPNGWTPGALFCGWGSAAGVVTQPAAKAAGEVAKGAEKLAFWTAAGVVVASLGTAVVVAVAADKVLGGDLIGKFL